MEAVTKAALHVLGTAHRLQGFDSIGKGVFYIHITAMAAPYYYPTLIDDIFGNSGEGASTGRLAKNGIVLVAQSKHFGSRLIRRVLISLEYRTDTLAQAAVGAGIDICNWIQETFGITLHCDGPMHAGLLTSSTAGTIFLMSPHVYHSFINALVFVRKTP